MFAFFTSSVVLAGVGGLLVGWLVFPKPAWVTNLFTSAQTVEATVKADVSSVANTVNKVKSTL